MEHCSCFKRGEILSFVAAWMNEEDVELSKIARYRKTCETPYAKGEVNNVELKVRESRMINKG